MEIVLKVIKSQLRVVGILLLFFSLSAKTHENNTNRIKVAILDQIRSQKISSIYYEQDYEKGIRLATLIARQKGFNIDYRYFQYGRKPLGIIKMIPELKKWHPDLVIGPRSSSHFLMLKNLFHNILVVSPIATDKEVKKLPSNFYSFTRTDSDMAKVLFKFIVEKLKDVESIMVVAALDCKSCSDVGDNLMKISKQHGIHAYKFSFLSSNVEKMNIRKIVKSYKKGTLIFTPNLSYVSGVIVERLVKAINQKDMLFMAADEWGAYDVGYVGKFHSPLLFSAYHLQNWSLDSPSEKIRNFVQTYSEIFHKKPNDFVTFSSYHALNSVVSTLEKNKYIVAINKRNYILKTFRKYVDNNPEKFLQYYYVIYKRTKKTDKPIYVEKIK